MSEQPLLNNLWNSCVWLAEKFNFDARDFYKAVEYQVPLSRREAFVYKVNEAKTLFHDLYISEAHLKLALEVKEGDHLDNATNMLNFNRKTINSEINAFKSLYFHITGKLINIDLLPSIQSKVVTEVNVADLNSYLDIIAERYFKYFSRGILNPWTTENLLIEEFKDFVVSRIKSSGDEDVCKDDLAKSCLRYIANNDTSRIDDWVDEYGILNSEELKEYLVNEPN